MSDTQKKSNLDSFGGVGGIAGAATDLLGIIGDVGNAANKDWKSQDYLNIIDNLNAQQFGGGNASLIEQSSNLPLTHTVTAKDLGFNGAKDIWNDHWAYGAKGAMAGAKTGNPWAVLGGAIAGHVAGLSKGFIDKNRSAKAAENLNGMQRDAFNRMNVRFSNAVNNADTMNDRFMKSQFAEGGNLESFNTGGSHEQNPLGGIPIGINSNGGPNLVEEGETKYNDYIYSNRLKLSKQLCKEFNIPEKYSGMSFADASKKIAKDSGYESNPTDNINKRGFNNMIGRLQGAQEKHKLTKMQNQMNKLASTLNLGVGAPNQQMFAKGGYLSNPPEDEYDLPAAAYYSGAFNLNEPTNVQGKQQFMTPTQEVVPVTTQSTTGKKEPESFKANPLMYAPILGNAVNRITDIFGITNKPDYTNSNIIGNSVISPKMVSYNPNGRYMRFNPIDTTYLASKMEAQNNATNARLADLSSGNRATAMSQIRSNEAQQTNNLGELLLRAYATNEAQRNATIQANNAIDRANAEGIFRADAQNQSAFDTYASRYLQAKMAEAQMREANDAGSASAINANRNAVYNDAGAVGKLLTIIDMIDKNKALLYNSGSNYKGE